jgi:hypothetical protein
MRGNSTLVPRNESWHRENNVPDRGTGSCFDQWPTTSPALGANLITLRRMPFRELSQSCLTWVTADGFPVPVALQVSTAS